MIFVHKTNPDAFTVTIFVHKTNPDASAVTINFCEIFSLPPQSQASAKQVSQLCICAEMRWGSKYA